MNNFRALAVLEKAHLLPAQPLGLMKKYDVELFFGKLIEIKKMRSGFIKKLKADN
ncbi:hypothetical protein ACUUL3_13810 [Thiovibrio sp. JS02]